VQPRCAAHAFAVCERVWPLQAARSPRGPTPEESCLPETLIVGPLTNVGATDQLLSPLWRAPGIRWRMAFAAATLGTLLYAGTITYLIITGIGLLGNNIPIAWGYPIINFVFWIEIAHAGTFISSVLLLLEQRWRTSINRIAEAMTVFAVINAGIFPILHLGRPWFAYWLIPYPSVMNVWPQFKSSLTWDVAAVSTYAIVSIIFWYVGMIPDLAILRDHSPTLRRRRIYGLLAIGWRGSARHMQIYRMMYGALAALITALVISVISVISTDFDIAQLPGWHTTLFPPYFVAAALYSGFALATNLLLLVRWIYRMENVITKYHMNILGQMLLLTGSMTFYSYIIEFFMGYYSGDPYERYTYWSGYWTSQGSWVWYITVACTLLSQAFWSKRLRTNGLFLFTAAVLANVAMWGDRFSFQVLSLQHDFLPSSWRGYTPSFVDWLLFMGPMAFFMFLFLLFVRFVPFIPVNEMKELSSLTGHQEKHAS
jgi:Ni/Fe-hydrogenase subunit HybB-like protein